MFIFIFFQIQSQSCFVTGQLALITTLLLGTTNGRRDNGSGKAFRALPKSECSPPAEPVTKDLTSNPFGLMQGVNNRLHSLLFLVASTKQGWG